MNDRYCETCRSSEYAVCVGCGSHFIPASGESCTECRALVMRPAGGESGA